MQRPPVIYRFAEFCLDEARRELRLRDREVVLQPRVFDLLAYLVRHRDRIVTKQELLEALWPGVVVTDSSLQRAMSLARSALREGRLAEAIRTHSRRGYRFSAEAAVEEGGPAIPSVPVALRKARDAYEEADWSRAVEAFQRADQEAALAAPDLERWAQARQLSGGALAAVGALERALAAHSAAGDRRGAARAALMLAQIHFEWRDTAVAQGWYQRAATLLDGCAESKEHGFLDWLGSRIAAFGGDLDQAIERAERALTLARKLDDPDLEAMGLLYKGLALLALGDTERGVSSHDEAAAAVLSGRVGPWAGGLTYCGVIASCRNRDDWRRAAQWNEHYERWCEERRLSAFPGTCRLYRAELMGVRGQLDEAEREILLARDELPDHAPWAEGDAHRVLGNLLLARGELDAAEASFQRAHELGWDPQPGYAMLQLERGQPDAALRSLERSLDDPGWTNRQRRGALLAHLVVVASEAGQRDRARAALNQLDNSTLGASPTLQPILARARAEVALGDGRLREAVTSFRHSLRLWLEIDAPLNVVEVRLRLARTLVEQGDHEGAQLELSTAEPLAREVRSPPLLQKCEELRRSLGG